MDLKEKKEYIIGYISLISNKIVKFGDLIMPDITFRQWFLLMMISKMESKEKTINSIAEFVGSSRQNVRTMLNSLEKKNYVIISKSNIDTRALDVKLTKKAYDYFDTNDELADNEINKLFSSLTVEEIEALENSLKKLLNAFLNNRGKEDE